MSNVVDMAGYVAKREAERAQLEWERQIMAARPFLTQLFDRLYALGMESDGIVRLMQCVVDVGVEMGREARDNH